MTVWLQLQVCNYNMLANHNMLAEAAPAVLKWSGQEVGGAMSSGGCG